MSSRSRLTLADYQQDDHRTLIVGGELDVATRPALIEKVTQLLDEGVENLTLDLGDLVFLDSIGLQCLRDVQRMCQARGCRLVLTLLRPQIRRVVAASGVEEQLPFEDKDA